MKKKAKIILIIGAAIVVAAALFGIIFGEKIEAKWEESRLQKQLELGQQYLSEEKYEQALACFTAAIEIDELCEEAYVGAGDSYVGMEKEPEAMDILEQGYGKQESETIFAKAKEVGLNYAEQLVEQEEYEEAIDFLERVLALKSDEEITAKIEEIQELIEEAEKQAKLEKYQKSAQERMKAFADACTIKGVSFYELSVEKLVEMYGLEPIGEGISNWYVNGDMTIEGMFEDDYNAFSWHESDDIDLIFWEIETDMYAPYLDYYTEEGLSRIDTCDWGMLEFFNENNIADEEDVVDFFCVNEICQIVGETGCQWENEKVTYSLDKEENYNEEVELTLGFEIEEAGKETIIFWFTKYYDYGIDAGIGLDPNEE